MTSLSAHASPPVILLWCMCSFVWGSLEKTVVFHVASYLILHDTCWPHNCHILKWSNIFVQMTGMISPGNAMESERKEIAWRCSPKLKSHMGFSFSKQVWGSRGNIPCSPPPLSGPDGDMMHCDDCEKWYHLQCYIGTTEEKWNCRFCQSCS